MKVLSRSDILAAVDLKTELVEVPEWGGAVYVRGLTGAERDRFEADIINERKGSKRYNFQNTRAKLAAMTIVSDENGGSQVFTRSDIDDLGNKSSAALQRVYNVAQRLSGLSDEDVEELSGNSGESQDESSTTD